MTTCPSVGEPGRTSAATMNARPDTTRISLPCGGSHWKWSPRTTPRTDRDWLTWTNAVGSPSSRELVGPQHLGEPAALVGEQAWPDEADLGQRGRLDAERHRYIIARPPSTPSTWPVM